MITIITLIRSSSLHPTLIISHGFFLVGALRVGALFLLHLLALLITFIYLCVINITIMAHTITTSGSSLIYNFDLPMTEMVGFKKLVARIKPNIPALQVSFGAPFEKAYTHVIKTEDMAYTKVYMH